MARRIRLSETELINLIRRVINEEEKGASIRPMDTPIAHPFPVKGMVASTRPGTYNTPENMKACKAAGIKGSVCSKALRTGIEPEDTPSGGFYRGFFCCMFRPMGPCCRKWGYKWKMPKMPQQSM